MASKKSKVYLRKNDGSGAGYIFNRDDADKFLARNPGYVEESQATREANQQAADEEAAADATQASAKKPRS